MDVWNPKPGHLSSKKALKMGDLMLGGASRNTTADSRLEHLVCCDFISCSLGLAQLIPWVVL